MKESEKRLLMMAGLVGAVILGLIVSKKLLNRQHELERDELALKEELVESKDLLQERTIWNARDAWLNKTQPTAKNDSDADTQSFQELVAKAESSGLKVEKKQYKEPAVNEYYHQFEDQFTVKGNLPDVFRWIYSVQSPKDFRVVPKMKITPDKEDPTKVVCDIYFWRWYRPSAQGA